METENIKQQFLNSIKKNNYCKNSKRIHKLFTHIDEKDEFFSYKEFIRRDLYTPQYTFGKFFLENKGIYEHISRVYCNKEHISGVLNIEIKRCIIFDIKIEENIYCCYIESNYESGCPSCGMGRDIDNFMYISYDLETLILHCLPPQSFCFVHEK